MNVIVKGMKMPDCCAVCDSSSSDDDGIYCNVLEVFMRFDELPKGRRCDCPLVELIQCKDCSFWDKEPSQTAMPEIHTCRYWRIGTTSVDYCARASKDGWMKPMPKEKD